MVDKELENHKIRNYSEENGDIVNKSDYKIYKIKKVNNYNYCNCEVENKIRNLYCKNCGAKLYDIQDNEIKIQGIFNIKSAIKISLGSVLLLLIISLLYKVFIVMQSMEMNKFVNPLHIMLAMNGGKLNVMSTSIFGSGTMNIKLGLVVMTMIPMAVIGLLNYIFIKKDNNSIKTVIINSILVGLIYGCALGILSIFTKERINTSSIYMYSGALVYSYSLFSCIINGFIISFSATFIVGIFNIKEKYMNIEIVKLAFKTIALGIVSVFFILTILSFLNREFIHDLGLYKYANEFSVGVVLAQLSIYMWVFANLIPVTISSTSISILGINNLNLLFNTKLLFIAVVFVSALIFIILGNKLKVKYGEGNIKIVKKFSIVYSLVIGVLALITKITVVGFSASPVVMGAGVVVAIVVAYLYSFIITLIGYKLS